MSRGEKDFLQIESVSLDSRCRNYGDPDNNYTISLGRKIPRVRSIKLSSLQFQEGRFAVPSGAVLNLSEPIPIPPNTTLDLIETCVTTDKTTNVSTTTTRNFRIFVPPTINKIVDYTDAASPIADTVFTEHSHGLYFSVRYYPLIGEHSTVVGGNFPTDIMNFMPNTVFPTGAGPVLSEATIFAYENGTRFRYVDDYMTELTGTNVGHAQRHYLLNQYTSFVYTPKPTIRELMLMINAAMNDLLSAQDLAGLVTNATNTSPILVTSANHGLKTGDSVTVVNVTGNTGANGTYFVTVFSSNDFYLDGSVGTGVYLSGGSWTSPQQTKFLTKFSFDDEQLRILLNSYDEVKTTPTGTVRTFMTVTGSMLSILGFNTTVVLKHTNAQTGGTVSLPNYIPPLAVQIFPLRPGTYSTLTSLAAMITERLQVLEFFVSSVSELRFVFSNSAGFFTSVQINSGFYTGTQFAVHLTQQIQDIGGNVRVSYDSTSRLFTFYDIYNQTFLMDMTILSPRMVYMLGFRPVRYGGESRYTSEFGTHASSQYPNNAYVATADETAKTITINTATREAFWTSNGTYVVNNSGVYATYWNTLNLPFSNRYDVGDVLYAQTVALSGEITNWSYSVADPGVLLTSAAHGLTTGDKVAVIGFPGIAWVDAVYAVQVVDPNTFYLVGSVTTSAFVPGGQWMSVSTDSGGVQVQPPIFTVVVKELWDPGAFAEPQLVLEPTASVALVLGSVAGSTPAILFHSSAREVFQLHFFHPEGVAASIGFPAGTWPPTYQLGQKVLPNYWNNNNNFLATSTSLSLANQIIPLSAGYTSPFVATLLPTDYFYVVLVYPPVGQHNSTYSWKGVTEMVLGKYYTTWPFLSISEEFTTTQLTGATDINQIKIRFVNPDGSPVQFNGIPHTFTLLFACEQERAMYVCTR